MPPPRRATFPRSACFHEAGHAVARVYVGSVPTAVHVTAAGSGRSDGTGERWRSGGGGQYGAWDALLVTMAGPMAEARALRRSRASAWLLGGGGDFEQCKDIIAWLVGRGFAADDGAAWQRGEEEVRDFLRRHWGTVSAVADALCAAGRLSAADVSRIAHPVRA